MIGLPGGWDEDLYDDKPLALAQGFLRTEDGKPLSKAAELLWRASEASRLAQDAQAIEEEPGEDQLAVTPTRQATGPLEPRAALADAAEKEPLTNISRPSQGLGVFGTEEYPQGSDVEVRRWTLCAPRMLSLASSFRASMRGGLVAQPVIDPSSGGTFRVRLLKLAPGLLCKNPSRAEPDTENDVTDGAALLEAQLEVGFAEPSTAQSPSPDVPQVPQLLLPRGAKAQALLERYLEVSRACLGSHAHEGIELLGAFFGGCTIGDSTGGKVPQWPPKEVREARNVACALSAWLARVNVRKVRRHLQSETNRSAGQNLVDMSAQPGMEVSNSGLRAVYHYLTANSVRLALEELGAAAGHAATLGRAQFDRLAAILASCGGSSSSGRPRRQCLQRQLLDWRSQGVHALMGPALWRIYCLLGGDIESVVGDSLDWRTAFGVFVWYRCPPESATSGAGEELSDAVHHFLNTVKVRGTSCGFRPAPPYAEREPRGRGASFRTGGQDQFQPVTAVEPNDLHFNIIRAAVGFVDWRNLSNFDYLTHTPRPLDVACSWHVCLLLLTLFRGDVNVPTFQVLTQQYCFLLEITGRWDMAVYVAQFLCNSRARNSAIYGLIQRHAWTLSDSAKLPTPTMQVPLSWVFRAKALRSELEHDWPGAVTFWMQAGHAFVERALILAMAFLQGPVLIGHADASLKRGAAEALCLAPLSPPALWLLSMLEEHEAALEMQDEVWADICRRALAFLRNWTRAKDRRHDSAALVHLYWRCNALKRHLLGVPW
mmetsp:Transcript_118945/g.237077  ORF Transcript_118945/g.237077 Transcript_118945/m.237077 type:complete len:771 (+) Transcript_118945:47-2359(+)